MADHSTGPTGPADERLRPGWSGPNIVLDAADPDSWGPGIAAALDHGHVLILDCAGIALAQTLAGHLHQFGAGVGCDVVTAVHPFTTSDRTTGGQLRAVFTEQRARPVTRRFRLQIVRDTE